MTGQPTKRSSGTSAIWGGRFEAGPAEAMEKINASIDFDHRLFYQDIVGSKAHCAMLVHQGIISQQDGDAILNGLDAIQEEAEHGKLTFDRALEDVHMNIESRLTKLIGETAGRLHTARSRNDQVVTDLRLWVRDAIDSQENSLKGLQAVLLEKAEQYADAIMPGFTHLQTAQPVTLGHHLLAYVEMLGRDRGRLADCRRRLNESPLGAAALAGTSFPIDRRSTANALGFNRPAANSLDAVSDRDFAIEYLSAVALLAVHLSRLAEEIVIWTSAQFGFIRLSDDFSTGSSIMPQKRNPDAAELVRAKTGRIIGALNALLIVMKGLPLAYSKDMQEDKEPVFDASDTIGLCVTAMTGMIEGSTFDKARMRSAAEQDFATATDLADWLVQTLGLPFRQAHHVVGALVREAEAKGCGLADLSIETMQRVEPSLTEDVYRVLTVEHSVHSRISEGGTAPTNVVAAIADARRRVLD